MAGARTSDLDLAGHTLLNLAEPTLPQHPGTKHYIDTSILGAGSVSSVFTRAGAVIAQAGDYDIPKITGLQAALDGKQAQNDDLSAIAALTTTSFGIGTLEIPDAAAFRTYIGAATTLTDNGQGGFVMFDETAHRTVIGVTLNLTISSTADINDWNPTGLNYVDEANPGALRIEINNTSVGNINITGIAGGYPNRILILGAITRSVTLVNGSTSSTDINRFSDSDIIIKPGESVMIMYRGLPKNRWGRVTSARGNSGVTAGSYTNTNLTVDESGRITSAINGSTSGITSLTGTSPIVVSPTTGAAVASLDVSVDHAFTAPQSLTVSDVATGTTSTLFTLTHNSSGTPVTQFGTGILFKGKSATVNSQVMGEVASVWKTATDALRSSALSLRAATAAGLSSSPVYIWPSGGISTSDFNDPGTNVIMAGGGVKVNNTTATTGTILQGVGGVFTATTYTLPASPGANGNIMTVSGGNWVSSPPSAGGVFNPAVDNVFTADQTITLIPGANISTAGIELKNVSTATNANQQNSPFALFTGQGFKSNVTAGSQQVDYRIGVVPVQGTAAPTGYLAFQSQVNLTGGFVSRLRLFTGGGMSLGGGVDPTIGVFNASVGFKVTDAAVANTILIADGTKYLGSTFTMAAPGTTGNVLTSDGTNWLSSAPTGSGTFNPAVDSLFTAAQSITLTNASTTTVDNLLVLDHESSGPPTAGFGGGILFKLESSTTASRDAAQIATRWLSATEASRTSALDVFLESTGASSLNKVATFGWRGELAVGTSATLADVAGVISADTGYMIAGTKPTIGRFLLASASLDKYKDSPYSVPTSAGTARKIWVSNGTDIVASTELWPTPGASGNVLTSDGTDWTSAAPAAGATVDDSAFGSGWNGQTTRIQSANSIYDAIHAFNIADDGTILSAGTGFKIAGGSAALGKILKSNGTNFVASTETYPAPSTSGNVMVSDGTNWTSVARARVHTVSANWFSSSALTTGKAGGYFTSPWAGTITGWSISADTGTCTIQTWKVANGTAVPTVSNTISTSGVQLTTGTHVRSSTVTDFTSTTVTAGDVLAFNLGTVASATQISFILEITE